MSIKNKKTYQPKPKHEIPKTPPEGYTIVHGHHGKQKVYTNGKLFISPDIDQHNGGWWKVAKTSDRLWRKVDREGTYNEDLTIRMGD